MTIPRLLCWCLAVTGVLAVAGCSERESALVGFELVGDAAEGSGPFRTTIDTPDLDTHYQATRRAGTRLWVGNQPGLTGEVEAKAFLRFRVQLPAGAVVVTDTLRLACDQDGDYGNPVAQAVAVERVVDAAWYEDTTTGHPFDAHEPLTPEITTVLEDCGVDSVFGTDFVSVVLPPGLIESWAADPESNHGVVLTPSGSGGFKRFTAGSVTLPIVYVSGGDTTYSRTAARLRTHATFYALDPEIEAAGTGTESVARIAGPHDYRGVVRFDLATLPEGASLHQMTLHLRFDPAAAHAGGATREILLGFHQLVAIPGEVLDARPPVSFLPLAAVQATVTDTTTALAVDVSPFGRGVADGILLKAPSDFPSLVQLGLMTREGPVSDRPRLEIVYTLPATGRF